MSTHTPSTAVVPGTRPGLRIAPLWRSRPARAAGGLIVVLVAAQIAAAASHEAQEFIFLGYFLPILIAARYFSRRLAIGATALTTCIYGLALIPYFFLHAAEAGGIIIALLGRSIMFMAAGLLLSSINRGLQIEKDKAVTAERDHSERLMLMLEVSSTVSSSLKIDQVLQVLSERIVEAIGVTFCHVLLLDEKGDHLRMVAAHPARSMEWEDTMGASLSLDELPDYRKALQSHAAVVVGGRREGPAETMPEKQREQMCSAKSLLLYPLVVGDQAVGVVSVGEHRSWERSPLSSEKAVLCQTIVNQGAVAVGNAISHEVLEEAFIGTIRSLAEAIDAKDSSTRGHSDWVAKYAMMIGRQMGLENGRLDALKYAGYLHDVGKIGIPDSILGKTSQLTQEEWQLMKKHPIMSAKILEPVPIAPAIKAAIRHHHERYDGKGYPYGLSGESIPLEARIMAVADSYEAMISDRPYRKALSDEQAVAELKRCVGSQFDPRMVEAFLRALGRNPHSSFEKYADVESAAS
ncbi:MAG: HD domain-containing phosphohydrolase [Thermoleophilia bacterium]